MRGGGALVRVNALEDAMGAPRRFRLDYDPLAFLVLVFGIGASTVLAMGL